MKPMDSSTAEIYRVADASTLSRDDLDAVAGDAAWRASFDLERHPAMLRAICTDYCELVEYWREQRDVERMSGAQVITRELRDGRATLEVVAESDAMARLVAHALRVPAPGHGVEDVGRRVVHADSHMPIVYSIGTGSMLDELRAARAELAAARNRVVELEEALGDALRVSTEATDARAA